MGGIFFKILPGLIMLVITLHRSFGQPSFPLTNARSQSLGGCQAVLQEPALNPSAISWQKGSEIMLNVVNPYSVNGFFFSSVSYSHYRKNASFSASVTGGGIPGMMNYQVSLSAGKQISKKFSAGAHLDHTVFDFGEGSGSSHLTGFRIGLSFIPENQLRISVLLQNPWLSATGIRWLHPYSSYSAGISYQPTTRVGLFIEATKASFRPIMVKIGVEADFRDTMYIRIGYGNAVSFGWGWQWRNIKADVGAACHRFLGVSTSFSISCDIKRKALD